MYVNEPQVIKTTRDFKAIAVPFGHEVDVPKDTEVMILQALGGTYTVIAGGETLRVDNANADALGMEAGVADDVATYVNNTAVPLEERIWAQLKTCYDPEIPVNIVDLGLIYEVKVEPLESPSSLSSPASLIESTKSTESGLAEPVASASSAEFKAVIRMTLTAPGCGMGPIIASEAKQKVLAIPGIKEIEIVLVFDPPWDRSRLSEVAKLSLGLM